MRIYADVKFKGARNEVIKSALIDTGAEISLIPIELAGEVGVWRTDQEVTIVGVHKQSRKLPLGALYIFFPSLNSIGGELLLAISDLEQEPIVGMDILKPLGITIDARTDRLSVKNEVWEAFKTLAGIGVAFYAGIKILDKLFGDK